MARTLVVAIAAAALLAACQSDPPSTATTRRAGVVVGPTSAVTSTPAPPTTTAATTTPTAPTPTSTSTTTGSGAYRLGQEARFANFTVRVDTAESSEAQGLLVRARVCVVALPPSASGGRTRISWDPWSVVTSRGVQRAKLYDGSHPPQEMYPQDARYAVGQCASGYIPFADAFRTATRVRYDNELGNHAEWPVTS